ncbi:MAG: biotin/lipoyl-binding protein, partial [Defluviitaleaceae bacterium]|nr:biotin/lipoyl-binding protein [Defluviitaleaceae bacterium]
MKILRNLTAVTLFAIFGLISCSSTPNDIVPATANIPETQAPSFLNTISVRGTVESKESRNIYSIQGHRVERVYVEVGDQVTQGQVLAVLNTEDLEFAIQQQTVALSLARLNNQTAVSDAERMLEMATRNLANNTNVMILHAQANLSAAETNLTEAQRMHDIATRDSAEGNDMQILNAESLLTSASTDLETLEDNLARLRIMYEAEFLSREDLRQAENAVTAARNRYNDANTAFRNAGTVQGRTLEHSEIILQSARSARQTAQTLLTAERAAAEQEIELLRSALINAEAATNVEQLEIALRQLERQLEEATITA